MSLNIELFKNVLGGLEESLSKFGFENISHDGQKFSENANEVTALYSGENGAIKISYADEKLAVYYTQDSENAENADKRIANSLLSEDANAKEVSFITREFEEIINGKFGKKTLPQKKPSAKKPQTVSKAAVKNGSSYDPSTLASKLCLVFPELRESYRANIATYGDFLAEEFFVNYGTPVIIDAIKKNHPQTMKKLFQVLNEIYEDGTNDTQSLIAVTILGELNNDQILLANCVDYMSETMAPPVIEVNKYLAGMGGKKAKKKLLNPPAYKPKKQKKQGFLDKMMSAGMDGSLNQQ